MASPQNLDQEKLDAFASANFDEPKAFTVDQGVGRHGHHECLFRR